MENLPDNSGETESNSLAVIVDAVGAFLGRVPASLHRNAAKVLGHLFKVPNAYLDGLAEEIKATSEARVKLTKATGIKLAKAVEIDTPLAHIAAKTHAGKILRQQRNAIGVLKYAVEEIDSLPQQNRVEPTFSSENDRVQPEEISDDWLNAFESEAVNMSSEQMQRLFGKMLAGAIAKPSSFSVRTVKLMGQMDNDVARLFQMFCSMSTTLETFDGIVDSRVFTFGSQGTFGLHEFGLNFLDVAALAEYGLLVEPNPSKMTYGMVVRDSGANIFMNQRYCNEYYSLQAIPPKKSGEFLSYEESGLALSRVGKELLSIVDIKENAAYTAKLISHLEEQGLHRVVRQSMAS